jgi:hypothetical protein
VEYPAQDLFEQLDAEGASVSAADAQDQGREGDGSVRVKGLAQELPGALAYGAGPVGAADDDQWQQAWLPGRARHRRLADASVAVAEGKGEPRLAELGQIGGQRGGVLPLRQKVRVVPGHVTHCCVQGEPVVGVGDIEPAQGAPSASRTATTLSRAIPVM